MFHEIPTTPPATPLLDRVVSPEQLRKLPADQLTQLADDLRAFLLYSVGQTGGHFGAGLGVIELTIALHYVFNTPNDDLIWDVGHQAYPHKILTGRRLKMASMRKQGGLSPFPTRNESIYDSFGVGHSSTSISAAIGMAQAKVLDEALHTRSPSHTVAIIGDGALTAGMAFEALNHLAHCKTPVLVILNDNAMSISANEGGLASYLERIWSQASKSADAGPIPDAPSVRTANLFEDLGIHYSGPVNGHDIKALVQNLEKLKSKSGPCLLHVQTQKGFGFSPAQNDPITYHALTKIENIGSEASTSNSHAIKYQTVFSNWICAKAETDERLIAITPAMREGSGLVAFSKKFPSRFFDVAIAEQHAVTFAAGLACKNKKPVVAIYSTFLQRAYDQLIHDVALQNLDVMFAIDRAGVVGGDGATHTGAFDISFLRCVPNLVIACPSDEQECLHLLEQCYQHPGPSAIRYPRGKGPGNTKDLSLTATQENTRRFSKAQTLKDGKTLCILNFGALLQEAQKVAEENNFGMVDMRWVKPLDVEKLKEVAESYDHIVTIEDGAIAGGAGSAVREALATLSLAPSEKPASILHIGLPDQFVEHGHRASVLASLNLDSSGIRSQIKCWLERTY